MWKQTLPKKCFGLLFERALYVFSELEVRQHRGDVTHVKARFLGYEIAFKTNTTLTMRFSSRLRLIWPVFLVLVGFAGKTMFIPKIVSAYPQKTNPKHVLRLNNGWSFSLIITAGYKLNELDEGILFF